MRSPSAGRRHRPRLPVTAALAALLTVLACAAPRGPEGGPSPGPADGRVEGGAEGPAGAAETEGAESHLARERTEREAALETGALPEIPTETGPPRLVVRYPVPYQRLAVADSNFVFGSVGTGDATLTVNGMPVPVEPNGAFLAWLPVPPGARGDTAAYRLVVRRGAVADTLRLPVLLPSPPLSARPGEAVLDSASLPSELPVRWARPEAEIALAVAGASGQDVWLEAGPERFPLTARPVRGPWSPDGIGSGVVGPEEEVERAREAPPGGEAVVYEVRLPAARLWEAACEDPAAVCAPEPRDGAPRATAVGRGSPPPGAAGSGAAGQDRPDALLDLLLPPDSLPLQLVAATGSDTVRLSRRLPLRVLDPDRPPVARLRELPDSVHGRRGVIVGRPLPSGPYRWRFPPESRVRIDGRSGDRLRARLAPDLHAWIAADDLELLPPGAAPPVATVADVRVEPVGERLVLRLGLDAPVPADVEQPDARTLALTLFGARGATGRVAYGEAGGLVEGLRWEQLPGERYRLLVTLGEPVWGWRMAYEAGDARAYEGPRAPTSSASDPVLRLEIRRPPRIDADHPLRGRRIAVDPGHPPAGATGPTGLYEGDANLAVARHLVRLLEEEGAEPVLLRTDPGSLGLYHRRERAEAAGAELFVSIHNNALPDGVRPFGREGTATYYYHPHALPLARAVQRGLLRELGLRDLGVLWGDLAVARTSWMPSVLAEGAFMMIPRHEAALRTDEFQERYARGVVRGLERFLEEAARAQARR